MESSTTLPTATVSPDRVRMLMVSPKSPKMAMPMNSESGMLMAATMVVRTLRRKAKMTRMAKRPPSRPSCSRPSTDSVMKSAWSVMVSMTMTLGIGLAGLLEDGLDVARDLRRCWRPTPARR